MNDDVAIEVVDLVKDFRVFHRTFGNLKGQMTALLGGLWRGKRAEAYYMRRALDHVSLTVKKGEAIALVGHNGSGKSTLLSILSRIYLPTSGQVSYRGQLMSLLELGAGFHWELTGTENVHFTASLRGMPRDRVGEAYEQIVHFAELSAETMDLPMRMFSSGMAMRLAFSVVVHMDADILLVDEALAVGDEAFQEKCFATMAEFKARGKTIVIVSHELDHVERLADRVVWLDHGKIRAEGDVATTLAGYRADMHRHAVEESK